MAIRYIYLQHLAKLSSLHICVDHAIILQTYIDLYTDT